MSTDDGGFSQLNPLYMKYTPGPSGHFAGQHGRAAPANHRPWTLGLACVSEALLQSTRLALLTRPTQLTDLT